MIEFLGGTTSRPPDRPAFPSRPARSFREIVKRRDHVFRAISLLATAKTLRPGVPATAELPSRLPALPGGARGSLRSLNAIRQQQRRRYHAGRHTALGSG